MIKKYPKVLIIGEYFTKKPGGTITMTHLFKDWNKENLAVAAENIEFPDFDICTNYYQLGFLEKRNNFPFNLKFTNRNNYSGVLTQKHQTDGLATIKQNKSGIKRLYENILTKLGLYHYKSRLIISKKLENWIKDFSPDYIYTQLSQQDIILFVSDLHKKTRIPLAIHIMDDWPVTIGNEAVFYKYWNNKIHSEFKALLKNSSIFLSISEAMSKEYLHRYGKNFISFHNPVDIDFWQKASKDNYEIKDIFTILYAGRIGMGIKNSFFDVAVAIQNLVTKGFNIELQLQITNHDEVIDKLAKFDFIKFNEMIPFKKLPEKLSNADLLLLPNDFEKEVISFLKFSMPTKASEYMISGTPILLYARKEAAITIHAEMFGWAYIVSENNVQLLEDAIVEIFTNKVLRKNLGTKAKNFAMEKYNGNIIREEFRQVFLNNAGKK